MQGGGVCELGEGLILGFEGAGFRGGKTWATLGDGGLTGGGKDGTLYE